MSVATAPELHRPPHDPFTLLLRAQPGWSLTDPRDPALTVGADGLRLSRHPSAQRLVTESSGSFGGLRTPACVTITDSGVVWLLEPGGSRLLVFDPCECRFVEVPCFGGTGDGPGRLSGAGGIATAAGHLFVCDTGNQRVQVVLMPQMVLAGLWRAPMPWQPTGVVVDSRFRVHVVDPMNGRVHRFGWSGRYLGSTPGSGAARHLALSGDGSLLAAGPLEAYRIGPDGAVDPVTGPADDLRDRFPTPPFEVAANGSMQLGPLCEPPGKAWFDLHGSPTGPPAPPAQLYERSAVAVLGPLDSLIDECVWHRVVISGEVPTGSGFGLDTTTAQAPLSPDEVAALPEQAWETGLTCTDLDEGGWDGLVRSRPGRYLWVRVRLAGDGLSTPRLDEAVVEFPRISLRRFLPAVYGAEPTSADFTDRLLAIVDRTLRNVETRIDDLPALLDPHATPHLDWLASWLGLQPDHRLPERVRRDLVADAGTLLDLRGTAIGLRRLLLLALGLDAAADCGATGGSCAQCPAPRQTCPPRPVRRSAWQPPPLVLEHFRLRRWLEAGAGTLGDSTILWGNSIVNRSQLGESAQVGVTALKGTQDPARDRFHAYAHTFTVFLPATAGRTQPRRRALEQLVAWGSPAHTRGRVEYVDARLRIGIQSSIGLDTVVARLPAGVTLGQTRLGPASVLDGNDRRSIHGSTVGATAVLG